MINCDKNLDLKTSTLHLFIPSKLMGGIIGCPEKAVPSNGK
jgi:hypothetical protein